MKNIWTKKDIKTGMLIIKESSPKGSSDMSFACTVVYKIGFGHFGHVHEPKHDMKFSSSQEYCLISVLTDGMVIPMGPTKEDLAEYLNKDEIGYRPLTIDEYFELVRSNQRQLFY